MQCSATIDLPLHRGIAPPYLLRAMKTLARQIIDIIVYEFGPEGCIKRIAEPLWFQSLACVLAFDWHSSGTTTVLTGILKSVIEPEEHGIFIAGGKGKNSRKTPDEIIQYSKSIDVNQDDAENLIYLSRLVSKIDNNLIQDGYNLYHHCIIASSPKNWCVIQQGMNEVTGYARRYHWLSDYLLSQKDFFRESGENRIFGINKKTYTLNLCGDDSKESRKIITELTQGDISEFKNLWKSYINLKKGQMTLRDFTGEREKKVDSENINNRIIRYFFPEKINWDLLRKLYDTEPEGFEDIVMFAGIGKSSIRALSLISGLLYDASLSLSDPVKYSFCFGGKDGLPYPVNIRSMEEVTAVLQDAIDNARIKNKEKLNALKKLRKLESFANQISQ